MKLQIEPKKVIKCQDWDDFVVETYKRPYCLQQQNGCYDRGVIYLTVPEEEYMDYEVDSIPEEVNGYEMGVSLEAWKKRDPNDLVAYDKHSTQLWWHRNFYPDIYTLANDLHKNGKLDAGEYIIIIDW